MKLKHSVGWFSSYDRGLDVLLSIWPKIKAKVPDASLHVAYGWNTYDQLHAKNAERMKWKWQMIRAFNEHDVKDYGRLSHQELADMMKTIQVLAYPTSFPEIDCITVKKAQAAGIEVVTSGYGALQESVWSKTEPEIEAIDTKPEELDKFAERVITALLKPMSETERKRISDKTLETYDWKRIASQWDKALS